MSRHSRSSSAGSRASFNSDVTTPDVSEASDGDVMTFDDMHLMEEEEDDDFADWSDEFESDHSLNDDDVSTQPCVTSFVLIQIRNMLHLLKFL